MVKIVNAIISKGLLCKFQLGFSLIYVIRSFLRGER